MTDLFKNMRRHNGKDGRAACVACDGRVFDVTGSFLWRGGNHQALHDDGQDLTESLRLAPHGSEMLYRFPTVGPAEALDLDDA